MGLGKQAKTLTKGQVDAVLGYLAKTRWPTRNRVIFLLSVKAGLRAKEIACLTWRMVTDARGQIGQAIHLEDTAIRCPLRCPLSIGHVVCSELEISMDQ